MAGWSSPVPRRNYWKETDNALGTAVEGFTPQMFLFCMGTGILSVLMHQNSYQFKGLKVIATVFYVLDLLLFGIISLIFIGRWIMLPKKTRELFHTDVEQTAYLSCSGIALATLVELTALIPGSTWHRWEYVSFSFWWIAMAYSIIGSAAVYDILIRHEQVHLHNLTPQLLYPLTAVLSTCSAGSAAIHYTPLSRGLSMPILVVCYMMLGMGFFLTILTLSAYFTRLLSHQTPPPHRVAAQLIPVAALSNAAYSFSTLGYLAGPGHHLFSGYGRGIVKDAGVGLGFYATGAFFSWLTWGFACFWVVLALIAYARDSRHAEFNLTMWSGAYPIGVFGIACNQIGVDLDSPAFKGIASAILIIAVIHWIWLVIYTLPMISSGELFLAEAKHLSEEEAEAEKMGSQGSQGEAGGQATSDGQVERRNNRSRASDETQV